MYLGSTPKMPQNLPKIWHCPLLSYKVFPDSGATKWDRFQSQISSSMFFFIYVVSHSSFPFFLSFLLENDINDCTHELSSDEQLHLLSKNPHTLLPVLSRLLFQATDTCSNTLSYHTRNRPLLKDRIQHRLSICRQRLDKFQPLSGRVIEKKSFVFAGQGSVLRARTAS